MATKDQHDIVLDIEGMTCASCVQKIEKALGAMEAVQAAAVNLATRTATIRTSGDEVEPLIMAVQSAGYGGHPHTGERSADEERTGYVRRVVLAVAFTVPVLVLTFGFGDRAPTWALWILT